ncbi:uncharacterized protein C1orf198 homolog isoform X1 [Ornithodoros turicata]|uniref:uncharacterized protein C1orf198 homolog isoform X1 n=1 Tax=Ornithodoros turicata TaxID=34597 RepID=UPI00313A4C55
MTSSQVRDQVESYFRSLNYASSRIMQDVSLIKEDHNEDWDHLSEREKSEIVWERLVCSEIKEKYNSCPRELADVEVFPVIGLSTGDRMVMDEENAVSCGKSGCWKDEHSAPFCWQTQSLLNLRVATGEDEPDMASMPKVPEMRLPPVSKSHESMSSVASRISSNPPTPAERKGRRRAPTPPQCPPPDPPRPKLAPPNPPQATKSTVPAATVTKTVTEDSPKPPANKPPALSIPKVKVFPPEVPKPTVPAPPPPVAPPRANRLASPAKEVSAPEISQSAVGTASSVAVSPSLKEIPKTGFDFLDNW